MINRLRASLLALLMLSGCDSPTDPTASDTTPPTIEVVQTWVLAGLPAPSWSHDLWYEARDSVGVVEIGYQRDDDPVVWQPVSPASVIRMFTYVEFGDVGMHTLVLLARDRAGNVGRAEPFEYLVEHTAPVVEISAMSVPNASRIEDRRATVSYVIREAHGLNAIEWKGTRYADGRSELVSVSQPVPPPEDVVTGELTIPLGPGAYLLELVATDRAYNRGTSESMWFTVIDTTPPSLRFELQDGTLVQDSAIVREAAMKITVADSADTLALTSLHEWMHGVVSQGYRTTRKAFDTGLFWGRNEISVTVRDDAGHETSKTVVVRRHTPNPGQYVSVEGYLGVGCGVDVQGGATCWERFPYEPYGSYYVEPSPQRVPGEAAFRRAPHYGAPVAGGHNFCGLGADGYAYCWRYNRFGSLGIGDVRHDSYYPEPQRVDGPAFEQLTTATHFSCGIVTDGTAWCWGSNARGQLGTPTEELCWNGWSSEPLLNVPCSSTPVQVASPERWAELAAAETFVCGLTEAGVAYCWGTSAYGTLGTGAAQDSSATPRAVTTTLRFKSIGAASSRTCAVATDGGGYCWGMLPDGLAEGSANAYLPTRIRGGLTFQSIGPSCGLTTEGRIYCWGSGPRYADQPVPLDLGLTFTAVSDSHHCGIATDSRTWCWDGKLDAMPIPAP